MTTDKKCKDRVATAYEERCEDLDTLVELEMQGNEEGHPELGTLWEYGLDFSYVPPDTYDDQENGYFRFQLSTGGPGDEFRFYADVDLELYKVEYWFLDWFDGAKVNVPHRPGDRAEWLGYLWETWTDCDCLRAAIDAAKE
mgnify:FL=1